MDNPAAPFVHDLNAVTTEAYRPPPALAHSLDAFAPISLGRLQDASLLRRVSLKFTMSTDQLIQALRNLTDAYSVLEIAGRRLHHYRTRYFDTPNLTCYLQHQNGWRSRYKVRSRTYLDTDLTYLEVKRKDSSGVTTKRRMRAAAGTEQLSSKASDFVSRHCPLPARKLEPTVWNTFWRITLAGTDTVERVTLDVGLTLGCETEHERLPDIVVAEVKQAHPSMCSRFIDRMRAVGLRPMSFSKYCVGVALFYPTMKRNQFKPTLLHLDRLLKESDRLWTT